MVFVIVGGFVITLSIFFVSKERWIKKLIFCLLGYLVCAIGIFCPVSGYHNVVVDEHVLEEILPDENKYVIRTKDNFVKYVTKEVFDNDKEKMMLHTNPNVEVVVVERIIRPVVKKYSIKPRKSAFTFALMPERIEYKIFINENNVKYE